MFCRKFDFGLFALLLVGSLLFVMLSPQVRGATRIDPLPSWDAGQTKGHIVDFVTAASTKGSKAYIAPDDRPVRVRALPASSITPTRRASMPMTASRRSAVSTRRSTKPKPRIGSSST
jgi:hypothetical protein